MPIVLGNKRHKTQVTCVGAVDNPLVCRVPAVASSLVFWLRENFQLHFKSMQAVRSGKSRESDCIPCAVVVCESNLYSLSST
jgi:hypothetical protein